MAVLRAEFPARQRSPWCQVIFRLRCSVKAGQPEEAVVGRYNIRPGIVVFPLCLWRTSEGHDGCRSYPGHCIIGNPPSWPRYSRPVKIRDRALREARGQRIVKFAASFA